MQDLVDDAVSKGATVTAGGMRNKDHPNGLFYLPTVRALILPSWFSVHDVSYDTKVRVVALYGDNML